MRTLYVRNVPEETVERVEKLAEREGLSVNAYVVRELVELARRAENPLLLGDLPDLEVSGEEVVGELEDERAKR